MKRNFKLLLVFIFLLTLFACASKSITEQIVGQTDDPAIIALATFADAQELYIAAQESYKPYKEIVVKSRPDLDEEIIESFRTAWNILEDWRDIGTIISSDKQIFRESLRGISINIAIVIEGGD